MTALKVFLSRALDLVRRRQRNERFSEEVQAHLELLTDEYVSRGMSISDARVAARRMFGGVDQVAAAYRDQRGLPVVDALMLDLRFALRLLARDRGFAVMALLVLGLGIGVNNMLFTILNAHTLRGLPIPRPDRVAYVSTFDHRNTDRGVSYPDFEDLRATAHTLSGMAAFANAPVTVGDEGRAPDRFDGSYLTANALDVIGVQPVLGRTFVPDDDRPAAPLVALLGSGAWRARYGGTGGIVGRSILINGAPATVIGVVPDRSGFPSTADVWLPLSNMPGLGTGKRDARSLRVVGRVRDGMSITDARAEIESIVSRLAREYPETNKDIRARVVPINERYLGRLTDPAWLAFMTVGVLVVVISCANVANLMLDRAVHRAREIAIRASLGASRGRVVRQLLLEASVLAALGGLLGLGLATAGVRLFRTAIPENVLPYWFDYSVDGRVLAALVAVSVATVFVFGLVPAVSASKTDVNQVLKDGGTGSAGRHARRWTTVFLTAEFALTVVMLANLALGLRIARPTLPSDVAIDTADVLTASITLPPEKYRTPGQRAEFYRRLDERVRAIPTVSAVSVASALPLMGAAERRLDVAGRANADG
ncbi:MAG: ABC transporter permease, partial [Acidobacteria bacterium]|nr:ABC transporter permease [Acidobacteriota bacterium]